MPLPCNTRTFIILLQIFLLNTAHGQSGMWTWVHGNAPIVFGTMGVSSPLNNPQPVYEGCEWRDHNGNFWLFGSAWNLTNTLWKYNPVTNEWTWMNGSQANNEPGNYGVMGVPSPFNQPRGRGFGCLSWVDNNNNLWMYGGLTVGSTNNHDLWKYDTSTNEWTWMNGSQLFYVPATYGTMGVPDPSNFPGGRYECNTTWTDATGIFWFFGGGFFDLNSFWHSRNDVWTYNPNTNEWTWMNGPTAEDDLGNYGTKGVSSPTNCPPARICYSKFESNDGGYYIFGGFTNTSISFNDLWRYDRTTNEWTWMNGSQNGNGAAVFGNTCELDSNAAPPPLWENRACWTDQHGNFWAFGGKNTGDWNNLWKYCPATNEWAFITGAASPGASPNYGTLGVASPTNDPGARHGSIAWYNGTNKLYLFSGNGMSNDLWTFEIDDSCAVCRYTALPVAIFTAPNQICPGTCTDFVNLSTNGNTYVWYFPGGNPSTSTAESPTNICYNSPGTYPVTLIATNANGSDTLTLTGYVTVYPYPAPQGIAQSGDTLFANAGAVSYQWYHAGVLIPGATNGFYLATSGGDYNVVATDSNGCEVEAVIYDVIAAIRFNDLLHESASLTLYPNPAMNTLTVVTDGFPIKQFRILDITGKLLIHDSPHLGDIPTTKLELDLKDLDYGMYYIEISTDEKSLRKKFIRYSHSTN